MDKKLIENSFLNKRSNTRLKRSSARPAMALPRTIIWLQGSSLPRTDDVNG